MNRRAWMHIKCVRICLFKNFINRINVKNFIITHTKVNTMDSVFIFKSTFKVHYDVIE
jgi:hypothetical protein